MMSERDGCGVARTREQGIFASTSDIGAPPRSLLELEVASARRAIAF